MRVHHHLERLTLLGCWGFCLPFEAIGKYMYSNFILYIYIFKMWFSPHIHKHWTRNTQIGVDWKHTHNQIGLTNIPWKHTHIDWKLEKILKTKTLTKKPSDYYYQNLRSCWKLETSCGNIVATIFENPTNLLLATQC